MPFIGHLQLHQVHDGPLKPYVAKRLADGRARKTVNLALGVVRRILNLAANSWRDDNTGLTWLERAPTLEMQELAGYQREPKPLSWGQQRTLMPLLPDHLARMTLFSLNTGVRDDVVCSLQWSWEIEVPELGISVFEVPREHVKGRRRPRVVVCNSVAQSIIESQRGKHDDFVFVWRRERVKNFEDAPVMSYQPIQTMNNTAWQNARKKAGMPDLHVHDLRHTAGMRLREASVPEPTIRDVLWHVSSSITHHYTVAQIVELHGALEKIKEDSGRWNKSLATLRQEHEARRKEQRGAKVPQKSPTGEKHKEKRASSFGANPLI
ncbi:tyrosine-type recombinase/integrase [Ideonella sp. A 288]|uniref:tyrosine-type recombinase/integrase n=1 Tax=Ideonella sp. A 288 TaxID=1962181 RepID=UPI002872FCD1|nr:tyrosine-type recombinase/integrase [Ideonella sp. A 288]